MTNIYSIKPNYTNVFDHELILKSLLDFFKQVDQSKKITINVNEGIDIIEDGILNKVKFCVKLFDIDFDNIQFVGCRYGTKYKNQINYKFLPYFCDFELGKLSENKHNITHTWNGSKKACMFFGRPQSSRLYFWELTRNLDQFDCNFHADLGQGFIYDQCRNYFYDTDKSIKQLIDELPSLDIPTLPMTVPITPPHNSDFDFFNSVYPDYLFEIVDESNDYGHGYFITEKTTRPLFFGKILLINGKPGIVRFLHRIGFDTFKDIIEWEFYDNLQGAERIQAIIELANDFDYENFDYELIFNRAKNNTQHHQNLLEKLKNKYYDQYIHYQENSF